MPVTDNIKPSGTGESPLANIEEWINVVDPETGMKGRRETNTMPQWAGSCWYYLRYIDPDNDEMIIDPELAKRWLPVDIYVGGAEHAVLHLLYARFWHKVLYDIGVVQTKEPFQKLFNQGMILGEGNEKMSKSIGNVINPDDIVHSHGADSFVYMKCSWDRSMHQKHGIRMALTVHVDSLTEFGACMSMKMVR